ncbi:MAG: DNA mismatch repair protein MutS, partial [Candidatus Hydrothermota bacterium]
MLKQYLEVKARHPEELLFFRMGDFYELFFEDAEKASRVLDITLTSKPMGKGHRVPLAGIPVKAAESYLARLLKAGYRVAICEQTGEGKGLMKREVVEVITPGTVFSP